MTGIPGLKPGTMKVSGSYSDWAKYSTSLRPGTRSRADSDALEIGEPQRPRLADRVAGKAESLAVHDLAAHLDHVGRGQVGSITSPEEAELPSEAPSGRHRYRTRSSRGRERRSGGRTVMTGSR